MTDLPDPSWEPPTQPVALVDSTPADGVSLARAKYRRRRRSWPRRILRWAGVAGLLGVGYYAVTLYQVWSTGRADEVGEVEAIIVLGAAQYDGRPSPQLAARLDHAVELYDDGRAPLIVTTGGKLPADRFTEAESSAAYLIEHGVPVEAIVQETAGRSTWESLDGAAQLLVPWGATEVVLVSDPYHMLRSRLIAEEMGLDALVSATTTSPVRGGDAFQRHLKEAAGVAVGRLIGFERLWNVTG